MPKAQLGRGARVRIMIFADRQSGGSHCEKLRKTEVGGVLLTPGLTYGEMPAQGQPYLTGHWPQ